jgi:outer membrane murein-binding lipoprotein Lpp
MRRTLCAVLFAAAALAPVLSAQQPTQRQVDSLAAQVRQLRARLDSLLATMGGRPRQAVPPGDELAALRAAAGRAAGRDTAPAPDTGTTTFVGRERNLSQLNPEIGATGDIRAYATGRGVQRDNFDPREFEIGFQSALDPYSRTKIFVSIEHGEVSLEEGYAYWTGLPGRLRLDVGKFRQQFGELNRWHLHAVPELEYPLALTTYLGEDGLAGTGLSLYRAFGGFGTHELTAQVTRSASDELFGGGGRPTYLAHLLNFWQLNTATYMQLGGTVLYGTEPDSALRTTVGGAEFRLTWRPPARALYREWTVRGELFALKRAIAGTGPTRLGAYVSSTYRLNRRFILGARYDHVESPDSGIITRQLVPSLTLWQSEWVFLRAQYQWRRVANTPADHQIALQAVWAIGPHKHETY